MQTITINDRIGCRTRRAIIMVASSHGIQCFTGKSIPQSVRVLKEQYEQNGKWSHTEWELLVEEGNEVVKLMQDFGTGEWLVSKTWEKAIEEVRSKFKVIGAQINERLIKAFIVKTFPSIAQELTDEEMQYHSPSNWSEVVGAQEELMLAHEELAKAKANVMAIFKATETRAEAERVREQANSINAILKSGKKMSLSELQELIDKQ